MSLARIAKRKHTHTRLHMPKCLQRPNSTRLYACVLAAQKKHTSYVFAKRIARANVRMYVHLAPRLRPGEFIAIYRNRSVLILFRAPDDGLPGLAMVIVWRGCSHATQRHTPTHAHASKRSKGSAVPCRFAQRALCNQTTCRAQIRINALTGCASVSYI